MIRVCRRCYRIEGKKVPLSPIHEENFCYELFHGTHYEYECSCGYTFQIQEIQEHGMNKPRQIIEL
jgi:hypothetical protein